MKDYKISKEQLFEEEPISKKMDIKNIYLSNDVVELNGKPFLVTDDFKISLFSEIGLKKSTITNLSSYLYPGELNNVLNKLFANYFKRNSPISGHLIGDRKKSYLFRFTKNDIITYKIIFDALDKIYTNYSDFSVNKQQGLFSILMREPHKIKVKNLPKETFVPNIGIKYDYGNSFGIEKVMHRLVCDNQIRTTMFNTGKTEQQNSIVMALQSLQARKHEQQYISYIHVASKVNASQREYEHIVNMAGRYTGKNNLVLDKLFNKQEIDDYLKSINFNKGTVHKEKVKVPVSYWNLINGLTDFASHDYIGLSFIQKEDLQHEAFKLLEKTPDIYKLNLNLKNVVL